MSTVQQNSTVYQAYELDSTLSVTFGCKEQPSHHRSDVMHLSRREYNVNFNVLCIVFALLIITIVCMILFPPSLNLQIVIWFYLGLGIISYTYYHHCAMFINKASFRLLQTIGLTPK